MGDFSVIRDTIVITLYLIVFLSERQDALLAILLMLQSVKIMDWPFFSVETQVYFKKLFLN